MTIPLSDKFAGLQPCTRKTPSLPLDAPQDTEEFTHEGVRLAYSPSTGKSYRLGLRPNDRTHRFAKWRLIKAGTLNSIYTQIGINGTMQALHRIIAQHFLNAGSPLSADLVIDHIAHADGSHTQDIVSNLRIVTQSQNMRNVKTALTNTTGLKGVSFHKASNKWCSQIEVNGKKKHIGLFQTPEAAYIAYCTASREYHGEYGYYDKSQLRRAIAAECARMDGDV